jgi:hypothetical protein
MTKKHPTTFAELIKKGRAQRTGKKYVPPGAMPMKVKHVDPALRPPKRKKKVVKGRRKLSIKFV